MVMSFNSERAREYLLQNGEIYTFRKNRRRRIGKDWANENRGGKAFADIFIQEIGEMNIYKDLRPFFKHSGFSTVTEWVQEIKNLNNGHDLSKGWLYKVKLLNHR